jgi:hypothetical protein
MAESDGKIQGRLLKKALLFLIGIVLFVSAGIGQQNISAS